MTERTFTTHDLKCWPQYFKEVALGYKPFELRRNDRDFRVGDSLNLREWNPETNEYTGRRVLAAVTYVLSSHDGLQPEFVVMGIQNKWVL